VLFGKGFAQNETEGGIVIGAKNALVSTSPEADLKFVEITGEAIGAGRTDLEDLKEEMRLLGAELLIRKKGTASATEASVDATKSQSALGAMAQNLEDALDQGLQFMADWAKEQNGGTVSVFQDFDIDEVTGTTETLLLDAVKNNKISNETFFTELQRRGTVRGDIKWEEEESRIANQAPDFAPFVGTGRTGQQGGNQGGDQ
jgi:hypothetical protein